MADGKDDDRAGSDEPLDLTAVVGPAPPLPAAPLAAPLTDRSPKTLAGRLAERPRSALHPPHPPHPSGKGAAGSGPSPESAAPQPSVGDVLARLGQRDAPPPPGAKAGVSSRPLDEIVEDVLRPILADWLDRNLERIVRDQVDAALQAEIAKRERTGKSQG